VVKCVEFTFFTFSVGDLQNTVLSMRDCAYEASVALSAFVRISRIHTTLTSESGSMLEEVVSKFHHCHMLMRSIMLTWLQITSSSMS